jgi:hypothetical protein
MLIYMHLIQLKYIYLKQLRHMCIAFINDELTTNGTYHDVLHAIHVTMSICFIYNVNY